MDNDSTTQNGQTPDSETTKQQQSSWPSETILSSIDLVDKIVSEKGGAKPANRKEIAIITGKAEATLVMKLSSCVQYGVLENRFGHGYVPGLFYEKYNSPVFDSDKQIVLLKMFANPELYKKLINEYNGKSLPNEAGLANHLKSDFGLNPNSSIKAAKIFLENCRDLNIIDSGNRLRHIISESKKEDLGQSKGQQEYAPPPNPELFKLPIQLPGEENRFVYFEYPKTLNKRDFKVIAKALTFVASSLITDETNEDYELKIEVKEEGVTKNKGADTPS